MFRQALLERRLLEEQDLDYPLVEPSGWLARRELLAELLVRALPLVE